ncbi:D-amino acid dehydrogenase [Jannaschia aquimarina]|uniref:DadA_2 protein n=1 Tax=Jannaschia aquimarina TaxID=935700 RepID=A0A0D1CRW2_9RHOB|nr:D-amino acid dehydrogenase [Jannaschia aquimarina]KIT17547.1 D-amino acid dehydrogenase small subunit [Jannaschia aquimarina]SNS73180.1 D-amino-acid dehydrogenase [Jannaschia aquimarina]
MTAPQITTGRLGTGHFRAGDRVAVIGGGITGVTAAYALLRHGLRPTLYERHPYAAMETSFANGGQLSASNAEVWNRLATVAKGAKWMVTPGAPLLVRPAPSWHKASWMAEFLKAIPGYEDATVHTVRLALEARGHLLRMAEEEGIDFDLERRGILHFYKTQKALDDAARVTKLLAKGGLVRNAVTPDEIATLEPALSGDLVGGFYTESDFTGDIHKFSTGLAAACARHGAEMRMGTEVVSLKAQGGGVTVKSRPTGEDDEPEAVHYDAVVICGGVASRRFASMLGDRMNVYPVKGYSITVNMHTEADRAAAPWVSLLDDDAKVVTSRLGADRYRVAGTAEIAGENRDIRAERIAPLVTWVRKHHPGLSTEDVRPWAGLRPMMPDMLPRVEAGKMPGVFYNTGHGHLGWTLSAATAEMVAGLVMQRMEVAA